jgi:hypothetical protein
MISSEPFKEGEKCLNGSVGGKAGSENDHSIAIAYLREISKSKDARYMGI